MSFFKKGDKVSVDQRLCALEERMSLFERDALRHNAAQDSIDNSKRSSGIIDKTPTNNASKLVDELRLVKTNQDKIQTDLNSLYTRMGDLTVAQQSLRKEIQSQVDEIRNLQRNETDVREKSSNTLQAMIRGIEAQLVAIRNDFKATQDDVAHAVSQVTSNIHDLQMAKSDVQSLQKRLKNELNANEQRVLEEVVGKDKTMNLIGKVMAVLTVLTVILAIYLSIGG